MSGKMNKKSVLKGIWWVKGNEQNKFTGILTYGDGYVPTLEIFRKEYDWDKLLVPNNSIVYGDVFWEAPEANNSRKLQAVTLLGCKSRNNAGHFDIGEFIYKQEFVRVECVAIGMQLNDDGIEQLQFPQDIYLTCPGLDKYSVAHALKYAWKDDIQDGRAYRTSDLKEIIYTPIEPIVIDISIGTIEISVFPSSSDRDLSSQYSIRIKLNDPTRKDDVNSLIYDQLLSFISIMTGRGEYFDTHSISISSNQTRLDPLIIDVNYGHKTYSMREEDHSMLDNLLIGRDMSNFITLFPNWRKNFSFVKDLAFHYIRMIDYRLTSDMMQTFPQIETYLLNKKHSDEESSIIGVGKTSKNMDTIVNYVANYFSASDRYLEHFPKAQRESIATQLANFRNKNQHSKSKISEYSSSEVYAYLEVLLRSVFLIEMEYPSENVDGGTGHWRSWRGIKRKGINNENRPH